MIVLIVAIVLMRRGKKKVKEPPIPIKATSLIATFVKDAPLANLQYLEKVLEVEGIVKNVEAGNGIVWLSGERSVMISVKCYVKGNLNQVRAGDAIRIQGICQGYMIHITIANGKIMQATEVAS